MSLADIYDKVEDLEGRLTVCERNIPKIHREILRNYTRAFYFDFITEEEYNKIKEDLEPIQKI